MTAKEADAQAAEEAGWQRFAAWEAQNQQRGASQVAQAARDQAAAQFHAAMERPGARDRFVANQDAVYDRLAAEWKAEP